MQVQNYAHDDHFSQVASLWDRSLGTKYPLSERVLAWRIWARSNIEYGSVVVAVDSGKVIGFGVLDIEPDVKVGGKKGYLNAVLVDPAYRRKGVGTKILNNLEEKAKISGCRSLSTSDGTNRFWTGVPEDLPEGKAFFEKRGFSFSEDSMDLFIPLGSFQAQKKYVDRLKAAKAEVRPLTMMEAGKVLDFEAREFVTWCPSLIAMMNAGDTSNILVLWSGDTVIGSIQTFTPSSHWRGPCLVWEKVFGSAMGGFGAVGIVPAWRKKGLGVVLCQSAVLHVQKSGGSNCYIDNAATNQLDFLSKVGARLWRKFSLCAKKI